MSNLQDGDRVVCRPRAAAPFKNILGDIMVRVKPGEMGTVTLRPIYHQVIISWDEPGVSTFQEDYVYYVRKISVLEKLAEIADPD